MKRVSDAVTFRTNAFALTPEICGSVYVVKAPESAKDLWWQATNRWRDLCRKNDAWLPHSSLAMALRVMSGDFVHVQPKFRDDEWVFLASRTPIPLNMLKTALLAWEIGIFDEQIGLARAFDEVKVEQRDVWEALTTSLQDGKWPPEWVREAARWGVVTRLLQQPLEIDNFALHFRVDSEASLLSWDVPVWAKQRGRKADQKEIRQAALSRIDVNVVTVPGHDVPHVLVVPHLSRLTDGNLGGWIKVLRVDRGSDKPLLRARIRSVPATNPTGEKGWKILWDERAAEVLDVAQLEPLPRLEDGMLSFDGKVRAAPKRARGGALIGKGPGQTFFDATATWAHAALPDLTPLVLTHAKGILPRKNAAQSPTQADFAMATTAHARPIRVVALYHDLETRKRMQEGLEEVLALEPQALGDLDDQVYLAPSGLEVVFRSPAEGQVLITYGDTNVIRDEVNRTLEADLASGRQLAVLVETLSARARSSKPPSGAGDAKKGDDPKPVIRHLLATKSAVTQFLANRSDVTLDSPKTARQPKSHPAQEVSQHEQVEAQDDHPAVRAVWDLLRGVGLFPYPFPGLKEEVPTGTWMVGIFAVRRQAKYRNPYDPGKGYALSLVAAQAGGHNALGFHPNRGWLPLAQATTLAHARLEMLDEDDVADCLERALEQLPAAEGERIVLFVDAVGCRSFWQGMQDTRPFTGPGVIAARDMSVVRVRSGRLEVPSGAGFGEWPSPSSLGVHAAREKLFEPPQACQDGAYYYLSTSRTMSRQIASRRLSRYAASLKAIDLKEDWHSWSIREFWSRRPGLFTPRVLARWATVLCRFAPTWDGILSRPSPLHLARCILDDHPGHILDTDVEEDGIGQEEGEG